VGELPKQLLAWMARLMPKMRNEGSGSVQVGKVGGNVTIVNVTQHLSHTYLDPQMPVAIATQEQRDVLRMIRLLPNSEGVYKFMERSFQTRMVIDLEPVELLRVRKYVESIRRRMGARSHAFHQAPADFKKSQHGEI